MTLCASAPAKLIFLGEYAVLEGAPALVAAIDRRARVTLADSSDGQWWLSAPELGIRDLALERDGQLPPSLDASRRASLTLFDTVRQAVSEQAGSLAPVSIHIDTAAFYSNGRKLGLGSSAAVAVALAMALSAAAGLDTARDTLLRLAGRAHRLAQGGIGSNADIAAAVYGGVLAYRSGHPPVALAMPSELWLQPVLLNESASTTDLVGRVMALKERAPEQYDSVMQPLKEGAEAGYNAFRAQDDAAFLRAFSDYSAGLEQLGKAAGADIVSEPHRALHSATRNTRLYYKSCGAGGGDIGLLVAPRKKDDNGVLASSIAHATGHELLAAPLGAPGVAIERADEFTD